MKAHAVTILLGFVGVAVIAVLVSNNAQTGGVLGSIGKSFSGSIGCALSPVLGGGNCGTQTSSSISFAGF